LRAVGIGSGQEDLSWLRAVDHAILLPSPDAESSGLDTSLLKGLTLADAPGPVGWNASILTVIS
jgi:hypothetical protein